MNEKMKKFGKDSLDKWNALASGIKIGIIAGFFLILTAIIIVSVINKSSTKGDYVVLFDGMSSSETSEVVRVLDASGTSTKMNAQGQLMVPAKDWDSIALNLAAKGYPKTTPTYGTFLESLTMTMTDWEKRQALIIAHEQKLESTLRIMEGINDASVTLNIAQESDLVWEPDEEKSTASVTIVRDTLFTFTPENVTAIKNLVAYATQKMNSSDVKVIDAITGRTLLSLEETLELENKTGSSVGGLTSGLTLEEQERQQKRQVALQDAFARTAENAAINNLKLIFGEENVAANATFYLNYDTTLKELTQYLPEADGTGVMTDELVEMIVDADLDVDHYGIVGEDENADIPTYQEDLNNNLTSSSGTYYKNETHWAISQLITQTEVAKGAVESASIGVTVIDETNAVITDEEELSFRELIAGVTNIPIEKVAFHHRYVPKTTVPPIPDKPVYKELFEILIWRIMPWLVGLVFLIILLVILLIAYGHRKTKREVRRAELESQAAIQSLQTTLDEHKRTLQDEVEAHQSQTNSVANEVRDFVKENPEITAALIRSMLRHDS